jgi:Zn-dependent peptidase ImmA (M78 family)/DNA-binding XRE family transcriptional regulator
MSPEFHPGRLTLARQRKGLSKVKLARMVGASDRSVSNWETGSRSPTDEMVAALSEALDVPSSFFFSDDFEVISEHEPSFRALSKMTAGERDSALAYGALALEAAKWFDTRFELPVVDVPRFDRGARDPDWSARRVRAAWNLGTAPLGNVVHLLEAHGVRVFSLPERLQDVDAFSFWWRGMPIILLNTRKSPERGRFDAAHELGHLVMHADWDLPRAREREWEANRFAASFLMPEEDVLAARLRNANLDRIMSAKRRWGVAAIALTHRLHDLGLISDWVYRSCCMRLSEQGYRRSEPEGLGQRESSQLLDKAVKAMRVKGISLSDVASDLRIHPSELQELVFGLALTPIDGGGRGNQRRGELSLVPNDE